LSDDAAQYKGMRRVEVGVSLSLLGVFACRAPAPESLAPTESGAFVVTLGNDTISVESFTRTGNRIEGVIVRRVPRTTVVRYTMTVAPSGLPARLEYNTRLPDGTRLPNGARTVIATFTSDSVFTVIHRDSIATVRVGARNAYPEIDGAVSFYALPIAALNALNRDSARFVTYPPGATQGYANAVARRGPNRYWVYSEGNPVEVLTDPASRILSIDGSRTTVRIQSRRQAAVDVAAIMTAFAERERISGPIVALSPRDSVIASISGVRIAIDYGRPAARGRKIWGPNGVLGDTLWRTGANRSTQFITEGALSIGGRVLAPGTYGLMTLAVPGRYQLIFYQNDAEVVRVPLQATSLDPPFERFTILVERSGDRSGTLRLRWETVELSVPFTVRG
jgi:hypothetical protein